MIPKSIIKEVVKAYKETPFEGAGFHPFRRRLKELGYKSLRSAKNKGAYNVFFVVKDGYIVKDFGGFDGKRKPKICVETYFISKYYSIVIQPLVDTKSKKAKEMIEEFISRYSGDYDFHDDNLGLYKDKLVCFDW